jgi:hypothetical protein
VKGILRVHVTLHKEGDETEIFFELKVEVGEDVVEELTGAVEEKLGEVLDRMSVLPHLRRQ